MVHSFLVCEEISVDGHLSDDGPILEQFLLDALVVLCQAEINYFVDHVVGAALVCLKVVVYITLSLVSLIWVACLGDEALAFTPVQGAGHIAALTSIVAFIA
jgi:hypothetical protein